MYETLKMMRGILNGKECKVGEKELIKEYQEKLSPNILAYFYVNNFGVILQISKEYPLLLSEDVASFCLQELDLSLQDYNLEMDNKFITYFSKRFKNLLRTKTEELYLQKNKANILCDNIEDKVIINEDINNFYIEDIDLLLSEYKLTNIEKTQSKLKLAGYTFKEISKILNYRPITIYIRNEKIKEKILNSNINFT